MGGDLRSNHRGDRGGGDLWLGLKYVGTPSISSEWTHLSLRAMSTNDNCVRCRKSRRSASTLSIGRWSESPMGEPRIAQHPLSNQATSPMGQKQAEAGLAWAAPPL
jgi:hypothetical protein